MKKQAKKILIITYILIAGIFALPAELFSQTVVFYFIAPRNTITSNFTTGIDSVDCPQGYSKIQVGAANLATFTSLAPPNILYVYNQLQPGNALRTNVNLVFTNSGGAVRRVEYWLVDDNTSLVIPSPDGIYVTYIDANDSKKYVWPAANNAENPANSGRYDGWIMLGEHQLATDQSQRTGGMRAVDEVVLHETSHTQLVGDWSKWGGIDGHAITYGADGMHYFSDSELIGDQEGALNEGMATYYGFIMNDAALQRLMAEYSTTTSRYFVEGRSVLAGSVGLYSIRDRTQTVLTDINGNTLQYADGSDIAIYTYRWHSVPGHYLLFAESTSTAFFSIFRNQTYRNKDTTSSMIRHTSQSMSPDRRKRFLTYACNRLALRMEHYHGTAAGRADASKVSSIFPFALLDLLTHFGMTDAEYQADYRRNNADRDPRAYTEYFTRRAAIRTLVQADINASPIRFTQALQRIIDYCKEPANMF